MNMINLNSQFVKILLSIVVIFTLFLLIFSLCLHPSETLPDIFNKIAVGMGTFLTGTGAVLAAGEWVAKPKREFELIKKSYPRKNLKKPNSASGDFELLRTQSHGRIYLHDLLNNTDKVRWIKNWPTMEALGFNKGDWNEIEDNEIDRYEKGNDIVSPDS